MSLETERSALEEIQTIERALADRILRNPEVSPHFLRDDDSALQTRKKRSFREVLLQQREMSMFLDTYKRQKDTLDLLSNGQGEKELAVKEIEDKTFELVRFNEFLNKIKSKESGNEGVVKGLQQIYSLKSSKRNVLSEVGADIDLGTLFSGEEYFGKYLDLIAFHEQWLNLSDEKLNYVKYLGIFDKFELQRIAKKDAEYSRYLKGLSSYLSGFIKRSKPLFDLEGRLEEIKKEFTPSDGSNPLFCRACNKTFAKQTVFYAHLTGKKHIKNSEKVNGGMSSTTTPTTTHQFVEFQIASLVKIVEKERHETKLNTERRKALTERERLIEIDQLEKAEQLSDSDSEDESNKGDHDENALTNPFNMPLGADGQPIPAWLYKLHGLDIEYECEICSNYAYKGRKAFDKHFLEAKHIHGLKCLGITDPVKFKSITKIEEAQVLWETIKREQKRREADRENAVEVEDEEGNVMSEKVYNDLKKQGLI